MRAANDTIIEQSESLADDWVSEIIPLYSITNYSIQLVFGGTLSGVFLLECTQSQKPEIGVWTEIEGSRQTVNEDGDHTWEVRETGNLYVRIRWLYSSGSGTLITARFNAKGS